LPPEGNTWKELFEAALIESDCGILPDKLKNAKNAILDRIEDCFDSVSLSERRMLLAALHAITELQRLSRVDEFPRLNLSRGLGNAA
jgi:hypothetical protein